MIHTKEGKIMSIRPIDLQVSVPRAGEVLKQTGLGIRSDVAQDEVSQLNQKKNEQAQNQVIKTEKTLQNAVNKDGKNGGQETPEERRKRKNRELKKKQEEPINEYGSKFHFKV